MEHLDTLTVQIFFCEILYTDNQDSASPEQEAGLGKVHLIKPLIAATFRPGSVEIQSARSNLRLCHLDRGRKDQVPLILTPSLAKVFLKFL